MTTGEGGQMNQGYSSAIRKRNVEVGICLDRALKSYARYHETTARVTPCDSIEFGQYRAIQSNARILRVPIDLYVQTAFGLVHSSQRTERNIAKSIARESTKYRVKASLGSNRREAIAAHVERDSLHNVSASFSIVRTLLNRTQNPDALFAQLVVLRHLIHPGLLYACPAIAGMWHNFADMQINASDASMMRDRLKLAASGNSDVFAALSTVGVEL